MTETDAPCALCGGPAGMVTSDGPSHDGLVAGPKPIKVCVDALCATNRSTKKVIKP